MLCPRIRLSGTKGLTTWLALAFVLGPAFAPFSVIGCARKKADGNTPVAEKPSPGGTLRILLEIPRTLDPVLVDDVYEGTVVNQVFEGLVRLDRELRVLPSLAASWVIAEEGRLYRFQLQKGVRFHDGQPLTAQAVVRSIERALDPDLETPCLAETYLSRIAGAEAFQARAADRIEGLWTEGDLTLCLRLEEPLSFFLSVLCMDQVKIVPPLVSGPSLDEHPIGTGPFRFVRRSDDDGVILARNEEYWGTPALIDTLAFAAATGLSGAESVARLLRGEVGVIPIGGTHRALVGEVAGYRVLRSPEISVAFLGLNATIPPLDRVEVRAAIAMALDRPGLIPPTAPDLEVATGVLPPRLGGYDPTPKVLPYDPQGARDLLAAAGYGPGRPVPEIDFYTGAGGTRWLEDHLAQQLAEIGITIRAHTLNWPDLDKKILTGAAPLFVLTWVADVPDPDAFLYFLFRSGDNLFRFADAEVDSLLAAGRRMPPGAERFEVYRRAEARVLSLAPMVPLYHGSSLYAWDPRLEGVELSPIGFSVTRFERIWFRQDEPHAQAFGNRTP